MGLGGFTAAAAGTTEGMEDASREVTLEGAICGLAFESGDRFVIGLWDSGPLGPMLDVMWAQADGTRVLLAPDEDAGAFVAGIYSFDRVETVPFALERRSGGFTLRAGPVALSADLGARRAIFSLRPRFLRRSLTWVRIEDVLLRRLVGRFVLGGAEGVRAFGTTRTGARQWYRIDAYRRVASATASVDGRDLGALRPFEGPVGFGFSEFPAEPAYVSCSPVLQGALPDVSARSSS